MILGGLLDLSVPPFPQFQDNNRTHLMGCCEDYKDMQFDLGEWSDLIQSDSFWMFDMSGSMLICGGTETSQLLRGVVCSDPPSWQQPSSSQSLFSSFRVLLICLPCLLFLSQPEYKLWETRIFSVLFTTIAPGLRSDLAPSRVLSQFWCYLDDRRHTIAPKEIKA